MPVTCEQPTHEESKPTQVELPAEEPPLHSEGDEAPNPVSRVAAAAPHKPGPHHAKLSDDESKALHIHNAARRDAPSEFGIQHVRNDLTWDDKLAAHATAYAKKLAHENTGLHHSTGEQRPGEGENLAWSKPHGSLADGSKMWVDEKKNYSGQKIGEGDFGSYGHYTQVIWPSTTRVGLGMAKASDGGWYIVGRYSPPGNVVGKTAW